MAIACAFSVCAESGDWANLSYFKQANDSIAQLDEVHRRVVFMGNSITHNWVYYHGDSFFSKNGFVGRGISGQTTSQFLLRFRQDVIDLHPKAVVILAGTNDIAENDGPYMEDATFGNIVSMVELARANGIKPVLAAVLPVTQYGWNKSVESVQDKIESLNRRLRAYARGQNMPFIDFYKPMAMPDRTMNPAYAKDGVHPLPVGYDVMEPLVLEVLEKLL